MSAEGAHVLGLKTDLIRYDGDSTSEWLERLGDVRSTRRRAEDEQAEQPAASQGETAPGGPSGPLDPAAEQMDTTD